MKFIEELVVEEFLPTFRSMLAEDLRQRGRTQNEVADLLGISQSAVSKYVHGEVDRNETLLNEPQVEELVERLAAGLTTGDLTPVDALVEAEVCIRQLERGGRLAELHAEAVPGLADEGHFDIHDPDSRLREAGQVRASVRHGLRVIRNTEGFARLIPAVGSNLVESLSSAQTIEDVAAVPGRILDVHGEITIPGEPEFGVSQHVASVLLATLQHGSGLRAAVNVTYDESLLDELADAGAVTAEFDAEADRDEAIGAALETTPEADVLYQTGGYGIEPIIYVLGTDAPAVATRLREVTGHQ
ncbi:thiamine-phosphate synthase family protein [Halovenus rubra]|uniref:Thiamine-phosphate synthase family protein n=2 Tax=Halovenus rubra TaxID=869890 RepID=A0ABD5X3G9_9EURY|nr:thiamine-phosphate synthase family protein [Halovenus rubra]